MPPADEAWQHGTTMKLPQSDRAVAQLLEALGARIDSTLVVIAADHGEAFGEHGEIGHSIFVYDTTLRIPLMMRGPGVPIGREVTTPVSLVDVAPTVLPLLDVTSFDADGVSLVPAFQTASAVADRAIYAESFAPLLDFGWSPLRTVRERPWKYIAAPRAGVVRSCESDSGESADLSAKDPQRAARLLARVEAFSGIEPPGTTPDSDATRRLRSLGYLGGAPGQATGSTRADPKDRIQVASRLAEVTSGEVRGERSFDAWRPSLRDDPENPQAHLRLGYAEIDRGRCDRAEPHLRDGAGGSNSIGRRRPCARRLPRPLQRRGWRVRALEAARELEPGNPVVEANLGLLALARNDTAGAIRWLESALEYDPDLLEARFALAQGLRPGRSPRRSCRPGAHASRAIASRCPPTTRSAAAARRGQVGRACGAEGRPAPTARTRPRSDPGTIDRHFVPDKWCVKRPIR